MKNRYVIQNENTDRIHRGSTGNTIIDGKKIGDIQDISRENLFRGDVTKGTPEPYLYYIDENGNKIEIPAEGQGPAVEASDKDLQRDAGGFTNPNLHRRIDPKDRSLPEVAPRSYQLSIQGVSSYRTTSIHCHDEDAFESRKYIDDDGNEIDVSEIP